MLALTCGVRSSPTRSINPNTPVFGTPNGRPRMASASSTVSSCSSAAVTAPVIQNTPSRLAMNPGLSLHATTLLPIATSQKQLTRAARSASVCGPVTSSSSRM